MPQPATHFDPVDVDRLKRRADLVGLVGRRVDLRRSGASFVGRCPFHDDRSPSFAVWPRSGQWRCFAGSCGKAGDVIDWLREAEGLDFAAAIEHLGGARILPPAQRPPHRELRAKEVSEPERAKAWRLWQCGRSIEGTATETYLRQVRGIETTTLPASSIRHVDALPYWQTIGDRPTVIHTGPAMLACYRRMSDGRFSAVQCVWLAPGGTGKADIRSSAGDRLSPKKIRGSYHGRAAAVLSLNGLAAVTIAEGIETGLSVLEADPDRTVFVAGSLSALGALPLPAATRAVTVIGDNDMANPTIGRAVLGKVCDAQAKAGRRVELVLPPEGMDFNDLLLDLRRPAA